VEGSRVCPNPNLGLCSLFYGLGFCFFKAALCEVDIHARVQLIYPNFNNNYKLMNVRL